MNRFAIVFAVIIVFSFPGSSIADQPIVGAPVNYDLGMNPIGVCSSDLDGDGDIDIAVALYSVDLISIFMNNGSGSYASPVDVAVGDGPTMMYASDIDLDGDDDLLVVNETDGNVMVLQNDGSGNFYIYAIYPVGTNPRSGAVADFNGDGSPDLIVVNYISDDVSVLINDGAGAFAAAVTYTAGNGANAICQADFDLDGDLDIAFSNYMISNIGVMMNNGDGTLDPVVYYSAGGGPMGICAADFDHDGYADLAVTNFSGETIAIVINDGDGTFAASVSYTVGGSPWWIETADFDGDGHSDLVTANSATDDVSVLFGVGDGTFATAVDFQAADQPRSVTISDLNGDRMKDFAVVCRTSRDLSVFFNQTPPAIYSARDIPGDQGGKVYLSWTGARADINMTGDITHYSIWRAIDPLAAISAIERGAESTDQVPELSAGDSRELIRIALSSSAKYYWELIETVDAYYMEGYGRPVATFFDSTAACDEYHYFQVIAHTAVPDVFWASLPDSGYSVDNIAPSFPLDLQGTESFDPEGLVITWKYERETDFDHFSVFRGLNASFETGEENLVAFLPDTVYFDGEWRNGAGYFYKLRVVDTHGNESLSCLLSPDDVTGTEPGETPSASFLGQNYPNPFNPLTTIVYGISEPRDVLLKIYDCAGRLVRLLVDERKAGGIHEVIWDGRGNDGFAVASGVYYYRLDAGEYIETKKMVLLK
ncbi:MAG: VCBS repeat-containing protein [Candidatus Krumholzibacteriota bacterium]|nr:VCBS repeat-containing protein [Candidatus Krumholzibacteriota bacterium]